MAGNGHPALDRYSDPCGLNREGRAPLSAHGVAVAVGVLTLLFSVTRPVAGQVGENGPAAPERTASDSADTTARTDPVEPDRPWWAVWSVASSHQRVMVGMWTTHPVSDGLLDYEFNRAVGVQYRGIFAITFRNSQDGRSVGVGLARAWIQRAWGPVEAMIGFQIGLVTGYGDNFFPRGDELPAIPAGQLLGSVRVGPVGLGVTYLYRALSVIGSVHF